MIALVLATVGSKGREGHVSLALWLLVASLYLGRQFVCVFVRPPNDAVVVAVSVTYFFVVRFRPLKSPKKLKRTQMFFHCCCGFFEYQGLAGIMCINAITCLA